MVCTGVIGRADNDGGGGKQFVVCIYDFDCVLFALGCGFDCGNDLKTTEKFA
jgi:hypothetical protein